MKVSGKFLVREVFSSEKKPVDYVSFVDMETGGDLKVSMDRGMLALEVGAVVALDMIVKGRQFGNGINYSVLQFNGQKPPVKS